MVARDKAVCGSCKCGFFRCGVKNSIFDDAVKRFENVHGSNSANVTRRRLSLGARDSTKGWRARSFAEDTVKGLFTARGSTPTQLRAGTYVRSEGLLQTCAGFSEGDEVYLPNGTYWEVKAVRDHYITPDNFAFRELDVTHLPTRS